MTSLKSLIPAQIKTSRLLLYLFDRSTDQYDCILKCMNSKSSIANFGDWGTKTPADVDKILSHGWLQPSAFPNDDIIGDVRLVYIVQEGHHAQGGPLIGTISLPQRSADVPPDLGWMIEDQYQGKGYASEAAKAVLEMLLTEARINRIMVWPGKKNLASIAVAKKIGFVEGPPQKDKDGSDALVYILPGMQMDAGHTLAVGGRD